MLFKFIFKTLFCNESYVVCMIILNCCIINGLEMHACVTVGGMKYVVFNTFCSETLILCAGFQIFAYCFARKCNIFVVYMCIVQLNPCFVWIYVLSTCLFLHHFCTLFICWVFVWCKIISDVKRGQNLEAETEAEARALRPRPRPRPELWGQGRGRGQFLEVEARPRPKIKLWIKSIKWWLTTYRRIYIIMIN